MMRVVALICVLWLLSKATPASAAIAAEIKVQDMATKEAARKNFDMKHTLKRRHQ
jgi:hypothetical protein